MNLKARQLDRLRRRNKGQRLIIAAAYRAHERAEIFAPSDPEERERWWRRERESIKRLATFMGIPWREA